MQNPQSRIGQVLLLAGILIFVIQLLLLTLGDRKVVERRTEVLRGDVEYAGGAHDVRPLLSVLGVVCLAGGLFTMALSGGKGSIPQPPPGTPKER